MPKIQALTQKNPSKPRNQFHTKPPIGCQLLQKELQNPKSLSSSSNGFFFYNLRDEFSTPEAQNTNKITIPSKTGFATTYPRINKFPIQREIKITTLTQQTDTLFQKKNSSCCYMFRKNHRMNMVRKKKKKHLSGK